MSALGLIEQARTFGAESVPMGGHAAGSHATAIA